MWAGNIWLEIKLTESTKEILTMKKKLEICCYSVESALIAESAGADRIELCDNYLEGGTTPSYAAIKQAVDLLSIPVNVIIRPRGGDFLYSDIEYEIIKNDVIVAKELNANGVVLGFLNEDGGIDEPKIKEIVRLAKPMEVTFHRAFDMCKDPAIALQQLIDAGVKRILTSGHKDEAINGVELLAKLVKQADENIIIMPGGGVIETNITELIEKTKAIEYHSSAKLFKRSNMRYFHTSVNMGDSKNLDEFSTIIVDAQKVKALLKKIS